MSCHYECRYCDRPAGYMGIPIKIGDEVICACGAEWEDAKVLVEDEYMEEDVLMSDEYSDWEDDDDEEYDYDEDEGLLDCGCPDYLSCECYNVR